MKKNLLITFLIFTFSASLYSQEVALSNNIMDVLSINPAFAGSKKVLRTSMNNQMRWYSAIHSTLYNSASVDMSIENFGIGFQGEYNILSDGFTNTNSGVAISYTFGNLKKIIVTPGAKFSFRAYSLNTENLVFYDQLSVYEGLVNETSAVIPDKSIYVADMSLGLLTQFPLEVHRTHPAWVNFGFAYDHIPKAQYSFTSDPNAYYPSKITIHGGVYIPFYQKNPVTKVRDNLGFMLYPNFKFQNQNEFSVVNIGALAYKNRIIFGLAGQSFKHLDFYNKNQVVASIGYDFTLGNYIAMQALYSFDLGISYGNTPVFMTHEFGISIFFVNERKTDCMEGLKYNRKRVFNSNYVQQRHAGECPPGSTLRRKNSDILPYFYPVEISSPDYQN